MTAWDELIVKSSLTHVEGETTAWAHLASPGNGGSTIVVPGWAVDIEIEQADITTTLSEHSVSIGSEVVDLDIEHRDARVDIDQVDNGIEV